MRMIARGSTSNDCQKRVDALKRDGWTPITEVKIDPSPTIDISYVCVLERKDTPSNKKKNPWNYNRYK